MMKLSTLWSVDRTIDPTTGRSPIADRIAAAWDVEPGSFVHFRSSANVIFKGRGVDGERVVLRFASEGERSEAGTLREVGLLDWLADAGVTVPVPRPSLDGPAVRTLETPHGAFIAALFGEIPGTIRTVEDLGVEDYRLWGGTVGQLHMLLRESPIGTAPQPAAVQGAIASALRPNSGLPGSIAQAARRLKQLLLSTPPDPNDGYGLIHGDLELDNLIWDGGGIAIIDFDGANESWTMLDIAKALDEPFALGLAVDSAEIQAFLRGYREHYPLLAEHLALLPEFRTALDLIAYLVLARSVDLEPADADAGAEWMTELIRRFRERMAGIAARIR